MSETNKPITMVINETKAELINVCNKSSLSPAVLDLILQGIYSEVHSLAERQALEEKKAYLETIKNKDIGDANETEKK